MNVKIEPPHLPIDGSELRFRDLLDAFPAAVYTTDAEGKLTFFNRAAEELAGRTPVLGEDRWCVAWRLYTADGAPLPLEDCPMAIALREGRPVRDVAVIAERPNGERVPLMPFPTPLRDANGKMIGAVNMLVDISQLKRVEDAAAQRAAEQGALFRFTDQLYRAATLEDVYSAALDAIFAVLGCSRASILLFDQAGVMQFVASRGLSKDYRDAVTGHTPWTPGQADPDPITIEDIDRSDESDAVKAIIRGEGIRALAFVPLVAQGGVIGKFMVYHDRPHAFGPAELDLALMVGRQLGFALERDRSRDYRARAERGDEVRELLASIVENSDDAIISKDLNSTIVSWNRGAQRIFGYTPDEIIGRPVTDLMPPELQGEEPGILERIRRGERIEHYETTRRRKDGSDIDISLTVSPVRDASGKIVGASKIARDVTDRKRAEAQRTLLINELNHRVKNTLATVQSLAVQTLRNTERSADARDLFQARIAALSRAHDLLTQENWQGASLHAVVDRAFAPFRSGVDRFASSGPALQLSPKQALAISIALHELATNAAKYGALSNETGRVDVSWDISDGDVTLVWLESGGPAVVQPTRSGFGTRLIERNLAQDLGGEAGIEYLPAGVRARMTTSLDREGPSHAW